MSEFGDFLDSTGLPQNTTVSQFAQFLDQQPQMTGTAREVALPASAVAKGALTSLGIPGNLKALGDKYISDPLLRLLGVNPDTPTAAKAFSTNPATSQEFLDVGRTAGLVDRPDLVPQNERERLEAAAFQGIGGAIPFAPLAPGMAGLAATLAGGAGGGVGSYEGRKAGEALGYPRTGELLGGLLGGVGGQTLGGVGARIGNAALGNFGELGQAYKTAGVPLRMTGDVAGSPWLQQVQAYSAKSLGGSGRTQAAAQAVGDAFGRSVENTASVLGPARTAQEAGTTLQTAARNWIDTIAPIKHQQAWAPINAAIAPDAAVPLTNYERVLADIQGDAGRLSQSGSALVPQLPTKLKSAIASDLAAPQPSAPGFFTMLRPSQPAPLLPATWQEAQRLRSLIGEARGTPSLVNEIGTTNLNRLYAALSEDMRTTAKEAGVGDAFDAANAASTRLFNFQGNLLSKVISSRNPLQETIAPERAADAVLGSGKSGGTLLAQIRQEMPGAANELGAYKLRDMALATAGRQNATGTEISPGSFLTDWSSLSPEAKTALYANPAVRQRIDALAKISEGVKKTQTLVNTSNSAVQSTLPNMLHLAEGGGVMGYGLGGLPGAAVGVPLGFFALPAFNRGASYLAANRALARVLAAQPAPNFVGQGGGTGALLAGSQPGGLLAGP